MLSVFFDKNGVNFNFLKNFFKKFLKVFLTYFDRIFTPFSTHFWRDFLGDLKSGTYHELGRGGVSDHFQQSLKPLDFQGVLAVSFLSKN